jgi:hypothetical protein
VSREHFTAQSLNSWLDTPAGQAYTAMHGSRAAAAAAMAQAEDADRTWRRQRADEKFERYPDRYESPTHAMRDVPDPLGGGGAWMTGSTDEIVAAGRRVDPAAGWRNLGGDVPDAAAKGYTVAPDGRVNLADTRPPWTRG